MTTIKSKKSDTYKYDAGKYKAHLTDYELKMSKDGDEIIIWKFDIEKATLHNKSVGEKGFAPINCVTSTILSSHPKCKMAKLLTAMGFKIDFDGEQEFELDTAISKTCMVLISDDEGDRSDFSKIVDFIKE